MKKKNLIINIYFIFDQIQFNEIIKIIKVYVKSIIEKFYT